MLIKTNISDKAVKQEGQKEKHEGVGSHQLQVCGKRPFGTAGLPAFQTNLRQIGCNFTFSKAYEQQIYVESASLHM